MIGHFVVCERCDAKHDFVNGEGYPKEWRKVFYERTTANQLDLCPACSAALDQWIDGQEQLS